MRVAGDCNEILGFTESPANSYYILHFALHILRALEVCCWQNGDLFADIIKTDIAVSA